MVSVDSAQVVETGRHALVGRHVEYARLAAALSAGDGGSCCAIHVRGEPGVGKTALVRAVLEQSTKTTVWCDADPMGQDQPYGLLLDGLAQGDASRPGRWPGVAEGRHHDVGDAIIGRFGALAAQGPVALVVDDVHWADPFTLRLLPRLMASVRERPPVLVTVGHPQPDTEQWRLLAGISRQCATRDLVLPPLTDGDCRALAKRLLGHEPPPEVEAALAGSGGNPLLLTRALARLGEPDTTLTLSDLPHLSLVSSACLRFLGPASVLGSGFGFRQLEVLSGLTFPEVAALVREAVLAGILEDAGGSLRFRHELIRSTLAADVPATVRAELHRTAARDLDEQGEDPVRVMGHLVHTRLRAEDFDWVHGVAQRCAAAAPSLALELWSKLLADVRAHDHRDPRRLEVETHMALTQLSLGQLRRAETTARKVLAHGGQQDRGELRACLTMSLLLQGRSREARSVSETGAAAETLPPWQRAEQGALAGTAALQAGDTPGATAALDRAERAAISAGSDQALLRVFATRGHQAHRAGELGRAREMLDEAVMMASRVGTRTSQESFAHALLGMVLADLDDMEASGQAFREGRRLARERGSTMAGRFTHLAQSSTEASWGSLERAGAALDDVLAREDEMLELWQPHHISRRALVALYRDGPDAAEAWLRRIPARGQAEPGYGMAWVARARAAVRLARGDTDAALSLLWRAWQDVVAAGVLIDLPLLAPDLVDAAVRSGNTARARAGVEGILELARRNAGVTHLDVCLLTVRGLAADDPEILLAAAAAAHGSPRLMEAARAVELAALAMAGTGSTQHAHRLCRDALALYGRAGAGFEAARARAAFRRSGIRVREPARGQARSGWEALTPAEQVVARYVEQGLSNADIADELVISRRTVESHVSHILAKLDLRSRSDLILAAVRRGRIPSQAKGPGLEHR